MGLINIILELSEWKLITILKLAVSLRFLLHCIIGEVDKGIIDIFQVNCVVSGAGTQVSLLKEVNILVLA